jgi:hypothetical protein
VRGHKIFQKCADIGGALIKRCNISAHFSIWALISDFIDMRPLSRILSIWDPYQRILSNATLINAFYWYGHSSARYICVCRHFQRILSIWDTISAFYRYETLISAFIDMRPLSEHFIEWDPYSAFSRYETLISAFYKKTSSNTSGA